MRATKRQLAVLDEMGDGVVRPVDVVSRRHELSPRTESAARGRLERMSRGGLVRRIPGRPAYYEATNLTMPLL